jgi:ubiquitin C-terminal hydrolase
LQLLLSLEPLRDMLRAVKSETKLNPSSITLVTAKLVAWVEDPSHSGPLTVKPILNNYQIASTVFCNGRQHDCHELVSFYLDLSHEELKINGGGGSENEGGGDGDGEVGGIADAVTPIQKIFEGEMKSTITCQDCGHESASFDPFTTLSLELPKVQKNKMGVERSVPLESCFEQFTKPESLCGADAWMCELCNRKVPATKIIEISRGPEVLVLNLKRFHAADSNDYRSPIVKNEVKTIASSLLTVDLLENDQATYQFVGEITHHGRLGNGHYTAEVVYGDTLYLCDDEKVSELGVSSMQPYMLAYRRIEREEEGAIGKKGGLGGTGEKGETRGEL